MENLVMNPNFWKGKRVLVTGHTGFKGSWISLWLQSLEANVIGYALAPSTTPNLFQTARVAEGMTSIIGDIRDLPHLQKVFAEYNPEVVIHMAAQPLVRYSYMEPVETYSTNVMGTVNLLEAIRHSSSVKAVVNVTSDKSYENREWLWGYREDEAMGGYDPYSSSKGCAELVTSAYRNSFFNPQNCATHGVGIASARAGNVIGGGDWADERLVPDIIRAISAKDKVIIRSPNAIRPWQHVLEPLSGYLLLAERLFSQGAKFSQAWNFGPYDQDAKPVEWIVASMVKSWGDGASYHIDSTKADLHEAHYLKLDCTKARQLLDWQPRWSIRNSIEKIVDWHKAHLENQDMHEYTINEIKSYTATKPL
nr:CDP-glucose 4,6-dehydratase [Methyloradius palustris]